LKRRIFLPAILAMMAALLVAALPGLASATPVTIDLHNPCVIAAPAETTPSQVLARKADYNCTDRRAYVEGLANWAVFQDVDLSHNSNDPWRFRTAYGRERAQNVYAVYADGIILKSPTSRPESRQIFSSADVVFDLPPRASPVTAILVRVEGLQNVRGVAPRAGVDTASGLARKSANYHMFYGLYFGMIGGMLLFNIVLFAAMRHSFQLYYCLFSASILLFAFTWSGGVFLLIPGLDSFGQVRLNNLAIALNMIAAPAFLLNFLEPGAIPRRISRWLMVASCVPLTVTALRTIDVEWQWQLADRIFYCSVILIVCALFALSIYSLRSRSHVVRVVMLGWTMPFIFTIVRALWAMNVVTAHSGLFDLGLFIVLGFESVISALGIGWRLRWMRRERDEAHGREQALTILAETDPLSGLFNRRAFLERAREGEHRKRLILTDIDRFKAINDGFGHDVGDQVIRAVADALVKAAPNNALVGRIGGEEFAVLVEATAPKGLAKTLCKAVARPSLNGGPPVTISAGVSEGMIADEKDWRLLYIAADEALYEAKRGGRNCVRQSFIALAEHA
jgi:diguanylate cyclase (GGDEF)-like protein